MGTLKLPAVLAPDGKAGVFIAPIAVAALFLGGLFLVAYSWQADEADRIDRGGNESEEALYAMFKTLSHAQSLVATSAIPTSLGTTLQDLERFADDMEKDKLALNEQVAVLEGWNYEKTPQIRRLVDSLVANAEAIDSNRMELRRLMVEGKMRNRILVHDFNRDLGAALVTSLDNQFHELISLISQNESSSNVKKEDFIRYHHMYNLLSFIRAAIIRLGAASAFDILPDLAGVVQEEYGSDIQRVRHSIEYLSENGGPHVSNDLLMLSWQFLTTNTSEGSIFDSLSVRLEMIHKERELVNANDKIISELAERLDAFAKLARDR